MPDTRYVSGNLSIANFIKSADCRMLCIGDSISGNPNGGMMDGIVKTWLPDAWAGFGAVHYQTTGQINAVSNYGQSFATDTSYTGANGPNSCNGWLPTNNGAGGYFQSFSGATIGAEANAFTNRIYEGCIQTANDSRPAVSSGGAAGWYNNKALTWKMLALANSTGLQSFKMSVRNAFGNTTYASLAGQSARNASQVYTTYSLDTPAADYTATIATPYLVIRPTAATTPAAGDNFIGVGCRVDVTGQSGLHLTNIAIAGTNTTQWANLSGWSQAGVNALVSFLQTNVCYIWLGQNNGGNTNFQNDIRTIINYLKAANPNMAFLLISPYQTNPATWTGGYTGSDYSDQLRAIAAERTDALFLDLWRFTGGKYGIANAYAFLNAQYLRDSVHPQYTYGYDYFARSLWAMIEMAIDRQTRFCWR